MATISNAQSFEIVYSKMSWTGKLPSPFKVRPIDFLFYPHNTKNLFINICDFCLHTRKKSELLSPSSSSPTWKLLDIYLCFCCCFHVKRIEKLFFFKVEVLFLLVCENETLDDESCVFKCHDEIPFHLSDSQRLALLLYAKTRRRRNKKCFSKQKRLSIENKLNWNFDASEGEKARNL